MADRTIVIVGATAGIGRAVAHRLAAQGERVIAARTAKTGHNGSAHRPRRQPRPRR